MNDGVPLAKIVKFFFLVGLHDSRQISRLHWVFHPVAIPFLYKTVFGNKLIFRAPKIGEASGKEKVISTFPIVA